MTAPQTIIDRISTEGQYLGDIVFARLLRASTTHNDLVTMVPGCLVPHIPNGATPEQAFRRAVRKLSDSCGYLLRTIQETDAHITVGIVREDPDEVRKDLDYALEGRIAFIKTSNDVIYDAPQHPVSAEFKELYEGQIGICTTEQIRGMIKAYCRAAHGTPMGTDWFVPARAEELREIKELVAKLGTGEAQMWLMPIHDSVDARETLDSAMKATLEAEISDLATEIAAFTANTRRHALENRLETFEGLRTRAKLYAGMLSVTHKDLNAQIDSLETHVARLLGAKETDND